MLPTVERVQTRFRLEKRTLEVLRGEAALTQFVARRKR
jgi:hypothetical protein